METPETPQKPFVTIAIATSDDEARIESCVRTALAQDYPSERVEIVVADAMSMDATREIVLRVAAELPQRITRTGGAVTVRRDIVVHKSEASSFKDLFRRHYELGKSRARRTVKERRVASIRTLAPLAIVAVGGVLVATSSVQPITP